MSSRSVAGLLAAVVVTAAALLGPAAAVAFAQPAPAAARPSLATPPGPVSEVQLRLNTLEPRIVTASGPDLITVTGVLVNTGSEAVRELVVRLQRSDVLASESAVRSALSGDEPADAVTPNFTNVAAELAPGAELPISITLPLRGSPAGSLALQRPGTYELLVNVNGLAAGGEPARLATGRMLLPVLDLPATPGQPADAGSAPATPVAASLLYPLADIPRRRPTGPGEQVVLTDDELASSLDSNGRLGGLVTALQQKAPPGSRIRAGICLAIDPELLQTVQSMVGGYQVRGADGAQHDGQGAAVAGQWLDALRATAKGTCVLALPIADADLVALSRNSLADLGASAVQTGSQIVATVLGTPAVAHATEPADGALDNRALLDYSTNGGHAVLLSADNVVTDRDGSSGVVRLPAATAPGQSLAPHAVLTDPLLAMSAATADGSDRTTGTAGAGSVGPGGIDQDVRPASSSPALAAQDAIGALAFRASAASSSNRAAASGPQVLAPPHRWNLNPSEAEALLGAFDTLVSSGRLTAADLNAVLTAEPPSNAVTGRLVYPPSVSAREVPASVATQVRQARDSAADLLSAAENEPGVSASPGQVFEPITEALLGATSAAWRGHPELATAKADEISARVEQLRSAVRVVEPPAPYALASEQAPLALTLANGLPVAMNVRVELSGTEGLRTAPIPLQRVPALGRLQLRVNTDVSRSGQFTVYATVSTPGGSPLGRPSRLLVNSTAYGTITLWLTGTAGALLVLLASRRIMRRIRRRADPTDLPTNPTPQPTLPPTAPDASDPHPTPDAGRPPGPGSIPPRDPAPSPQRPTPVPALAPSPTPSPTPRPTPGPAPRPTPSPAPIPAAPMPVTPSPSPSSPAPPR